MKLTQESETSDLWQTFSFPSNYEDDA